MANEINSVAGQLIGLPVGQVYTAGDGISIDAVNKVVTNIGTPVSKTVATRCGTFMGKPCYTKLYEFTGTVTTSWTTVNLSIDEKIGTNNVDEIWVDFSNSFIEYQNSAPSRVRLPLTYMLGNNRFGSVSVIDTANGSLTYRGIDAGSTPLKFMITIKYTVSA